MENSSLEKLSKKQKEKLADLLLDIAKSLFVAVLVIPAVDTTTDILLLVKATGAAFSCTFFALNLLEYRKQI